MLNRSASLAMSTRVLKALPDKLDIKRHSPSILYIPDRAPSFAIEMTGMLGRSPYPVFNSPVFCLIHRVSYMSAHVLLNLLNEFGKIDKMRGLPSILSLFHNEFNKFNNTRA